MPSIQKMMKRDKDTGLWLKEECLTLKIGTFVRLKPSAHSVESISWNAVALDFVFECLVEITETCNHKQNKLKIQLKKLK